MLKMGSMIRIVGWLTLVAWANAGSLIGEDTPVWIAYRPDPAMPVNYTMLERGIVKQAIDSWKAREPYGENNIKIAKTTQPRYYRAAGDFESSKTSELHEWSEIRKTRGIAKAFADDQKLLASAVPYEMTDAERRDKGYWTYDEDRLSVIRHPPIRPPSEFDIHILVAMDYPSTWPSTEQEQQTYIKDRIVYAVAFWHAIHFRIKSELRPKYNIRIVGIIIGRNKEAAPYLRNHETDEGLSAFKAAVEMNTYWENIAKNETDFPLDGRQLLVTMTESKTAAGAQGWDLAGHDGHHGMVYSDELAANSQNGLDRNSLYSALGTWSRAKFTEYAHLSSGKPISVLPLPGQIISPNKQCEARGWAPDNEVCYMKTFPCNKLACRNDWFLSTCSYPNAALPALDGTYCKAGRVCMQRKCVDRRTLTY